jgi:hypothetical protein
MPAFRHYRLRKSYDIFRQKALLVEGQSAERWAWAWASNIIQTSGGKYYA